MDKRLIILTLGMLLLSGSWLVWRRWLRSPEQGRLLYIVQPSGSISIGDSIRFEDRSTGVRRWKWDFGDGTYSFERSGTHQYLEAGRYTLRLTAYGPEGILKDSSKSIRVLPPAFAGAPKPVASPGAGAGPILGPAAPEARSPVNYQCPLPAGAYEWSLMGDPAYRGRVQRGDVATFYFRSPGPRILQLKTSSPDGLYRRQIMVRQATKPDRPGAAVPAVRRSAEAIPAAPAQPPPPEPGADPLSGYSEGVPFK